jgi:hypothetical protein
MRYFGDYPELRSWRQIPRSVRPLGDSRSTYHLLRCLYRFEWSPIDCAWGRAHLAIHEIHQALLARLKRIQAERAAKQFVPQPNLVGADYVSLAVVGDLLDLTLVKITLHLTTIETLRLPRRPITLLIS